MQNHLVDNHPDRMPLYCDRNGSLENTCDGSLIESTDVFSFYYNFKGGKNELLHSRVKAFIY